MPHNYAFQDSSRLRPQPVWHWPRRQPSHRTPRVAEFNRKIRTQGQSQGGDASQAIDVATAKALNTAIEALNMEKYAEAQAAIGTLSLEKLSPYERSKVEQILFNISYRRGEIRRGSAAPAKVHRRRRPQRAGDLSGALPGRTALSARGEVEGRCSGTRGMVRDRNESQLCGLLPARSGVLPDGGFRARAAARTKGHRAHGKAAGELAADVAGAVSPEEQFNDAIPLLVQLVETAPDKKTYWMQLSAVYGQVEDYANALAVMQLAYEAGLVTEDPKFADSRTCWCSTTCRIAADKFSRTRSRKKP